MGNNKVTRRSFLASAVNQTPDVKSIDAAMFGPLVPAVPLGADGLLVPLSDIMDERYSVYLRNTAAEA